MSNIKTVYAQSSDIKSRSYLEYRRDMKKKAIAELETAEWLAGKLTSLYGTEVDVSKSGGDAFLWFAPKGAVTGEADFEARYDGVCEKFEFQYADKDDLPFFDFKVSKVGKKAPGEKREPFSDKQFIYIVKSTLQYAIIKPKWIMENGKEAGVPAWGNRTAFRVPNARFKSILTKDATLDSLVKTINLKTRLLNFQFDFLRQEEIKLSHLLQSVIDKDAIVKFVPKNLDDFYKVCFIIDKLNETPENASLWFVYVLTFFDDNLTSYDAAKLVYCMDYLYSKITLQDNEIAKFTETIESLRCYCRAHQKSDGRFETSLGLSPKEEARNFLFITNLLEDLIQDSIFYYHTPFAPIEKIFGHVKCIDKIDACLQLQAVETAGPMLGFA